MRAVNVLTFQLATAVFLCMAAASVCAQQYRLPFEGRWFVAQAGDTLNVNHHMGVPPQWYAIDFAKVGGPDGRALARGEGTKVEDFYGWGEPVLAPVDGVIETVVDEFVDNPIGSKDPQHAAGNHVVIRMAPDKYVFLAHLQKGSVTARPGQKVRVGQQLARCGNSGNSDFPHLHMHVQETPRLNHGHGQNTIFGNIDVELTGKIFKDVDWPLIRGLFVWTTQP